MFEALKQYLVTGYLKFKESQIFFGDERVVLYFVPHLAKEYRTHSQTFGPAYAASMFLAGREQGQVFVKKHAFPLKKTLTLIVKISCEVLSSFGFGSFKTLKVNEEDNFMVLEGKSILGDEIKKQFGPQEAPVDAMLGGLYAGALSVFSKQQTYSFEFRCVAQADVEKCVFITGTENKICNYISEFAPERLLACQSYISEIKKLEEKV